MASTFEYNGVQITWLFQSGFLLEGKGKRVYFDPMKVPDGAREADAIFITHDHFDHCDPSMVGRVVGGDTRIIAPDKAARKLNMFSDKLVRVREGDGPSARGIYVRTVPSYNSDKTFHPRGSGLGYVISFGGSNFYHAGDTDFVPEMAGLRDISVAFLPIGGTYTMDLDAAAKAANSFKPKVLIPMHYNCIGDEPRIDATALASKLDPAIKLVVLEPLIKE